MSRKKMAMLAAALVAAGAGVAYWLLQTGTGSGSSSSLAGYQAVYLDNGMVLYGRLEGLGGPFPVLREVYVSKSGLNLGVNRVVSALGKRSYELHTPSHTVLNGRHIRMTEPVRAGSAVANSIIELRGR